METEAEARGFDPTERHDAERARLVRFCARLTGDRDAAEDLAQETLVAAWRQERALRDPSRREQWLLGIARNLCRMWIRGRARESVQVVRPTRDDADPLSADESVADTFDLVVDLERHELVDLLDRALALLPPDTRDVLVDRYVRDSPHAEIAARLGLSENAVAKRIERGKLALKGILTTNLRDEATSYGLVDPAACDWQATRLWCFVCGQRHLLGRFAEDRQLWLDCVGCLGLPRSVMVRSGSADLFRGVKGYKPSLNRLMLRAHETLRRGIAGRTVRCRQCNAVAPLHTTGAWHGFHYVEAICPHCGAENACTSLGFLALSTPEGRCFYREHPRIQALPDREIEMDGRPAVVTRQAAVGDNAILEVVFVCDTVEVIAVHGAR